MGNKVSKETKMAQKIPGSKADGCCLKGPLTVCAGVCWDWAPCRELKRKREKEKNELPSTS